MSELQTQLAVVGAGPGGYAAAFLAADLGLEVTLIDDAPDPGGVCLYRGCIPSKALLHVAKVMREARAAHRWGITFGEPTVDLDALRAWKDQVVGQLTGGLGVLSKQRKVTYVRGRATVRDAHSVTIASDAERERVLRFDHAILATGSSPAAVPGLSVSSPRVLDSTTALDLGRVPDSLLVIGGGYIGLELGTVYAALGAKVSIVEMMPGLLPGVDRDLVKILGKRVEAFAEAVWLEAKVTDLVEEESGLRVTIAHAGGEAATAVFDQVLVAVGRRPNPVPGLERTKAQVDERGFVRVDAQRRTAEPSLFAIGDLVGEPMLAHKASHEGRVAAEAVAGHRTGFEPLAIPAVVFTDPEIAWCGLTEAEASRDGKEVTVTRFPWAASGRAVTLDDADGVTKLVLDPGTGQVLGVGIAGAGAGELIAEGVLAVEMGATAADLRLSIHPHPTLSETIMESAEIFFGQSTHYRGRARRSRA